MSVKEQLDTFYQSILGHVTELEQEKQEWLSTKRSMEREIAALRKYKDVSMVKSLSVQNDELQTENTILRKKLNRNIEKASELSRRSVRVPEPESAPVPNAEETTPNPDTTEPIESKAATEVEEPTEAEATEEPTETEEPTTEEPTEAEATEEPAEAEATEEQAEATEEQAEATEEQAEATEEQAEATEEPTEAEATEEPTEAEATEEPTEAEATEEPTEADQDMFPISLTSGSYNWDPDTGDLHNLDTGDVVGRLKTVSIRKKYYYVDTVDNHVYHYLEETGDIGDLCGRIENKKFKQL